MSIQRFLVTSALYAIAWFCAFGMIVISSEGILGRMSFKESLGGFFTFCFLTLVTLSVALMVEEWKFRSHYERIKLALLGIFIVSLVFTPTGM